MPQHQQPQTFDYPPFKSYQHQAGQGTPCQQILGYPEKNNQRNVLFPYSLKPPQVQPLQVYPTPEFTVHYLPHTPTIEQNYHHPVTQSSGKFLSICGQDVMLQIHSNEAKLLPFPTNSTLLLQANQRPNVVTNIFQMMNLISIDFRNEATANREEAVKVSCNLNLKEIERSVTAIETKAPYYRSD